MSTRRSLVDIEREIDARSAFKLSVEFSSTPGEVPVPGDFSPDCQSIINTADKVMYLLTPTNFVFAHSLEGSILANTYFADDASISTTSLTAFLNKLTLSENFTAGVYAVFVSYGWNYNSTGSNFEAQVLLDNVLQGTVHSQEPQDSGGSFFSTGTDQRHPVTRMFLMTLNGAHDIDLEFRSSDGGTNASIFDAAIVAVNLTGIA